MTDRRVNDRLYYQRKMARQEGRNPVVMTASPAPKVVIRIPSVPLPEVAGICEGEMDLFFSADPAERKEAMRICRSCPTQEACLRGAIQRGEQFGVWGGVDFEAAALRQAS